MLARIALHTIGVLVLIAALSTGTSAQDPAGTQQGLTPYSAFHGGDIDSISMVNLKLNLHIPLVSYPQRGGNLRLGYYLTYYNQIFNGDQECSPPPNRQCFENYTVTYTPLLGPPQTTSLMIVPDFNHVAASGIWDADGTTHLMGQVATNLWRSMDATGYTMSTPATNPMLVTDRGGTRYTYTSGSGYRIEDANGNLITGALGSNGSSVLWTDTIGRSIPDPFNIGANPLLPAGSISNCPSGQQSVLAAYTWSLPGMNGGTMTYTICTVTLTLNPNIFCGSECPAAGRTRNAIQSIVLPNGTSWKFEYDNNGEDNLTKIIFPTGGSISYAYGHFGICTGGPPLAPNGAPFVTSRTVDANDGTGPHTWTYSQTYGPLNAQGIATSILTTVTDPLGNATVHTEAELGAACSFNETEVDRYNGAASGTPVEKVVTTYNFSQDPFLPPNDPLGVVINFVPTTVTTTLDNGQTKRITKTYDTGVPLINTGAGTNVLYGNVLTETETDYGTTSGSPGPTLRTTTTNYQAFGSSAYLTNNLLSLPSSIQVTGPSGTAAFTTYGYDETGLSNSTISTQHDSSPPVGSARGNQTSIHKQLNSSATSTTNCPVSVSSGGYLVSYNIFYDTGTVNQSTDACGSKPGDPLHTTTFNYSSNYVGGYLTSATNPKGQTTSYTYDLNSGQKLNVTDSNSQVTSYTYDVMWRPTQVTYPDTGQTTYCYTDEGGSTCSLSGAPYPVITTKKVTSSPVLNSTGTAIFDGLGRTSQTQVNSDPSGVDYTVTTYDADGRVASVTNPYRTTSDSTYGVTQYQYDGLSRTKLVTKPDGSKVTTAYCGSTTLVTDEAGKWRRSTTDGLGRLIEVDEPNSTTATVNSNGCPSTGDPIWATKYTYDTLNNLSSVNQGGSHARSFVYDSISWLRFSTNPETGTSAVSYFYDTDGNVISKSDARGITINYSYDNINRMIGRSYSNNDPAVTYTYDQSTCVVQTTCYNIGRRTSMSDAGGSEVFSYDTMGRLWGDQRTTNGITKNTGYTYNLDGSLYTLLYAGGRTITYTYDGAAHPISAKDVADGITYDMSALYAPQGAVAQLKTGPNLATTIIYNDRLQPCWVYATTGTPLATTTSCTATDSTPGNILDLQYNFNLGAGDNGNVIGITNNRDTTRSQSFTYDQVNRIVTGGTGSSCGSNCWGQTFAYDQWTNLTTTTSSGSAPPALSLTVNGSNQITTTGFSYDAAGNLTKDLTSTYNFNAESEITLGGGVTYTYDGDGQRVMKSNGKIYWYGQGGEILNESDLSGNMLESYVFFGGKRIGHHNSSQVYYYYVEDFLGTSRSIVQSGQTSPCYDTDFFPFGGEKDYVNTCPQNYKFEGKERDTETGNDEFGARYYSSVYGRWLSPDWSTIPAPVPYANLNNPQTLNLYAMLADNPETFADLDGHACDGPSGGPGGTPCNSKEGVSGAPWEHKDTPNAAKEYHQDRQNDSTHQGNDSKGGAQDKTTRQQAPGTTAQQQGDGNKKDNKSDIGLAGVGIIAVAGSETGPIDLLIVGAAASVYLAQNANQTKKALAGLAATLEQHLGKISSHPPDDPNQNHWRKEVQAIKQRMERLSKRVTDNVRVQYNDLLKAAGDMLQGK